VKARARQVLLVLPKAIRPLLGPMGENVIVAEPDRVMPPFEVHCPLMSLPLAFGTRVDTIPGRVPYLAALPERLLKWRTRLPYAATPRIGLVWSGSSLHPNDRDRSLALERLGALLDVPGVSFVSLQRDYRDHDRAALLHRSIERIDDALADFADTAAAIEQCDLVISVDTSVAHLAGALGKPFWLLLPFVPDWRWLLGRADSPWYPTARLFRQPRLGDWESVIADVARALSLFRRTGNSSPL
jgi:hypothetical protein